MKNKSASDMLATTIDKIRDAIDTKTIIGDPIKISEKLTVIPISSVKYGFASGGSDFPSKSSNEAFGGAGGAGVTITPVAFLVINGDIVTVKNIGFDSEGPIEKVANMVPDILNTVTMIADKFTKDKESDELVDKAINNIE